MRMSGFIVGGLVGAAAAMYFSKNNRQSLTTAVNWDQAVDKAGKFVRSAKDMWDTSSIIQMSTDMANSQKEKSMEAH
jgi:gas vesicle protein